MRVNSRSPITTDGSAKIPSVRTDPAVPRRQVGGAAVVPSRYGNRFAYGHERSDLTVSGGLGCSIVPLRIGVPPEIVMVRLRGGGASA
jgi:hypothetical protein